MKGKSLLDILTRVCFFILVFFMLTIVVRFVARQILVERLGWDNTLTSLIFIGDERMNNGEVEKEDEGETVSIDWATLYPFEDESGVSMVATMRNISLLGIYEQLVSEIKSKVETYAQDLLIGHMALTRVGKRYNAIIGCATIPMKAGDDNTIILRNGYMTYTVDWMEEEDLQEISDNVSDFSKWLSERGIGFVYANAGSKICEDDKELPAGESDYINENANRLIQLLEEQGVDVLDYRPLQKQKYSDWYSSYYITDHHWKNTTGLWAAGELARHLNDAYGFGFDMRYFDESMYLIETTDNYFLGGQGKGFTSAVVDPEPFSKIKPNFKTRLSITDPTRGVNLTGAYEETLFREDVYDNIATYTGADYENKVDAYSSVMWRNDALGNVKNYLTADNSGKKILMLQDSFGYFLSTYLALDIPEIDLVNLQSFTGSIKAYIEDTKPDVVVILLCEKNIAPIDDKKYLQHENYYDFR